MAPGVLSEPATVYDANPAKTPNSKQDEYGQYHPIEPEKLSLESNFGPMQPGTVGYLQPTSADIPIEIMRERFQKDGYLLVGLTTLHLGTLLMGTA